MSVKRKCHSDDISSLVELKVIILTTSMVANDENFAKMEPSLDTETVPANIYVVFRYGLSLFLHILWYSKLGDQRFISQKVDELLIASL